MKVPFFDLRRLYLEQKPLLDEAVLSTLDSGYYILGSQVTRFETSFRDYLSESKGSFVTCNSGTDALILCLLAHGVGAGDEVLTVSHTAIPTVSAIRATGALPVFIDIDPDRWLMDLEQVEGALTPKTKAIIAVHLYGNLVRIDPLREILRRAKREDIAIIEDVAQASGSKLGGRQAGTLSGIGAFSFYPTKNIGALGDGGGIYCADPELATRVGVLRNYGQKDRYHAHLDRGINSRLDEIQAAILSVKLKLLDQWIGKNARLTETYRQELSKLPLRFQKVDSDIQPAWHLCVVELESESVQKRFTEHLSKNGVGTIVHYPIPCHEQPAFEKLSKRRLPVTESLARRIVSLPMNPALTSAEHEYVIEQVRRFF